MAKTIKKVEAWWKKHVEGGVSPKYDEKKDADILKVLRANSLSPDSDLDALVAEAEQLQDKLNKVAEETAADEKRLKTLKDLIKEACMGKFRDGDKQVIIQGSRFEWVTSRSTSLKVDEAAMKKDGVLDKYKTKETVTYKLTPKERKE
jgi:flagellin-like hook-associated protein FlgL